MQNKLEQYDFTWIRNADTNWATQRQISVEKSRAMLPSFLHYDVDISSLIRFLGSNYTAAYRHDSVEDVVNILRGHKIDNSLINQYKRVVSTGCPAHFVAETTRANHLEYWQKGNNPSILNRIHEVMTTMNKEERNNYVIALPSWLFRFIPHVFFTPQHYLEKVGKKGRLIFDGLFRHSSRSIPVNMMTSTDDGTELHCAYGDAMTKILMQIWNLRITYPSTDIVIHANDVKSYFCQLKHHPDVAAAFSYILGDFYLSSVV